MSFTPIEDAALESITGGGAAVAAVDSALAQLGSLKSELATLTQRTSGLSSTDMMLLFMVTMQQRNRAVVVVR